ncbi:sulfite exporter TauE/SafE family protein [Pendulispora albinea]|uniref:Probable membrane transporter protein n=1 Tax=Pendulispora albinea TaxID=2741071 RepID=A0ABZ2LPF1_9BACT
MPLHHHLFLFTVAVFAGALNTVAGGGSFLTFPALMFVGIAPVAANATNALAIWPAGVAGAFAYRRELSRMRTSLVALSVASFLGGLVGAVLLLLTTDAAFMYFVPWLLLAATVLFSLGGVLTSRLRMDPVDEQRERRGVSATGFALQFVISLYGGYFGGGMGIMMLAAFTVMGMSDLIAMNAVKTVLTTVINGIAIVAFIAAGKVAWAPALLMAVGATLGGYGGAIVTRKVSPKWMRAFVLVVAWAMTVYFFAKQYLTHA